MPKWVIRNRKSKKDRQYNGQNERKDNNQIININNTEKSKDRPIGTPLKTGMNSGAKEG
jgi:hypothetical protein